MSGWHSYDGYRDRKSAVSAARDLKASGVVSPIRVKLVKSDAYPYHVQVQEPMRYAKK